ncbi:hypothetical protein ACTOWA_09385 [Herbaspirillum seropedicae]|uniref:hypothetical protein n=1 Tax=Herbaspirillum seropedicae TaxID=964 RepID=UPI003F8D11CD
MKKMLLEKYKNSFLMFGGEQIEDVRAGDASSCSKGEWRMAFHGVNTVHSNKRVVAGDSQGAKKNQIVAVFFPLSLPHST